jgi:formyl-CoA transferase
MDQAQQQPASAPALHGVRVIELSQYDTGASCGEVLAWYGADVVKIEPPEGVRARHATSEEPGVDAYEFIMLNANKRSVTCDLAAQDGRKTLRKLIANADVLIDNLAPGAVERLGFGYDVVREINPRLIFAQIKCFAGGGPRAHYLGDDTVAQSVGGLSSRCGYEGGQPLTIGPTLADTGAGLHAAQGILAALHQRQSTGRGQRIEVAMQESIINLTRNSYMGQAMRGKPLERSGNGQRRDTVPSDLFPCKPGGPKDYVFITISRAAIKHWNALLKVMGHEDLVGDARYATGSGRVEHANEIIKMVSDWCRQRTKSEVMEAVNRAGAPAGALFDMHDLSSDPNLRRRGTFVEVEHPVRGKITLLGWPVKMSDSPVPVRSAPLLGAHTQEVLAEWLAPRGETPHKTLPAPRNASGGQALSGIRVLDLSHNEAGPACTEALAWLGADVVKVEEPTRGDRGRYGNSNKVGVDAHYFIFLNANKRSVACDLKLERGKDVLRKLIQNADVMIENMGPGVIDRLGFDYEAVRKLNPGIVFVQVKGYPGDGPYAKYVCFDSIAQSAGGSLSITGVEGDLPLKPAATMGDCGTGMHVTTGILAALCQRQRSGRGQKIEMAMQEGVINFCRMGFARYLASGKLPERVGDRDLYRCLGNGPNDYCAVNVSACDEQQWQRLLQVIGRSDLSADARFTDARARAAHRRDIDALLTPWCAQRDKTEAMDSLQQAGVPAGAVFDTMELQNDPYLRKSGMFATIEHPVRGPTVMPAYAVKMSETFVPLRAAPLLGEHTGEVLSE